SMKSKMPLTLLIIAIMGISAPAFADSQRHFPGKGSKEAWDKAGILVDRSIECAKRGDLEGAIKYDRQAISIYPFDSSHYHNLGNHLCKLGKFDDARKELRQAI